MGEEDPGGTDGRFLPGLVSAAFTRRRPTRGPVALGLAVTVAASGLLGHLQDAGTSRGTLNDVAAVVGGVVLHVAILAYLVSVHFPAHPARSGAEPPAPPDV